MRPIFNGLALGLALLSLAQPALARSAREDIEPAEERIFPFDAQIPGCQDSSVLERVSTNFAESEAKYWNSSMTILSFDTIARTALAPLGPRYLSASVLHCDRHHLRRCPPQGRLLGAREPRHHRRDLGRRVLRPRARPRTRLRLRHRLPDGASLRMRIRAACLAGLLLAGPAAAQDYGGFARRGAPPASSLACNAGRAGSPGGIGLNADASRACISGLLYPAL